MQRPTGARPTRDRQRTKIPVVPSAREGSVPGKRGRAEAATPKRTATIIQLQTQLYLLWATPAREEVAFEVSKVVDQPLQARCPTAPLCPSEAEEERRTRGEDADLDEVPVDPNSDADPDCPYAFCTKAECIRERNIEALRTALFPDREAQLVANYLRALGYEVRKEQIALDSLNGSRVLMAHSRIYNVHDVRVLCSPGGQELVLIRNPY